MRKLLKKLPYDILMLFAVVLAIVPIGEPHLLEKIRMLLSGNLVKGLDYFDLIMHSTPIILLVLKFAFSFSDPSKDKKDS